MCNCIVELNKKLIERNTRIVIPITFGSNLSLMGGPIIKTEKIDSKKRVGPVNVLASYCPFCGNKYDEE